VGTGPAKLVLMSRVARRYYLDGRSKSDIAAEFKISRFRVARLLEASRQSGLVRIVIEHEGSIDTDLSRQLQSAYGLANAVVIDIPEDDPVVLRRQLGEAAAGLLEELVTADDVLGLAWARSLSGIGPALTQFVPCPVVQLTGALSRPDASDVLELVRGVARVGGGPAYVFYAPLVVADAGTARMLRRQPDFLRAAAVVPAVTVAAVGIGAWSEGLSTIFDAVEPDVRARVGRSGVVGEISGVFIDGNGREVITPLSKRIIGLTGQQLSAIKVVVGVAYGEEKADAVRAALVGGLVTSLVTHCAVARHLIKPPPAPYHGSSDRGSSDARSSDRGGSSNSSPVSSDGC
jgi:DNA-binding transcriptional regulator LsrR (DeoR family)